MVVVWKHFPKKHHVGVIPDHLFVDGLIVVLARALVPYIMKALLAHKFQ